MSLELTLYIIDFLTSISNLFNWILIVLGAALFILVIVITIVTLSGDLDKEDLLKIKNYIIITLVGMFGLGFINSFIPEQKTMYLMTGIHLSKEAMQTEMGQKAYKVLDKKLDEYLKEEVK